MSQPSSAAHNLWVLVVIGLLVAPLVGLQFEALSATTATSGYGAMITPRAWSVILTTVLLTLGSALFAIVLGVCLAICMARLPPRLRALAVLPLLPIAVPPVAAVVGWVFMLTPNIGYLNGVLRMLPMFSDATSGPLNVYSLSAIVFITGLALVPFVVVYVSAALRQMDPTLLEAAKVFGASSAKTYARVVIPLLRPAIVYAAVAVSLLGLGQFTAPLLLGMQKGVHVLTTEMYIAASAAPPDFATASAWASPLVILGFIMIALQSRNLAEKRKFVVASARGFGAGFKPTPIAALPIVAYFAVAVLLPVAGLLIVALSPFWSATIPWAMLSLAGVRETLMHPDSLASIKTTLLVSLSATAVATVIGYAIAATLIMGRNTSVLMRRTLDVVANLPLTIPSIVFGVGILLMYAGPPFRLYGTYAIFVLAYVTLILPHVVRVHSAGLISLGGTMVEAARVCGASDMKVHQRILLPLLRRQLGGGAAICLAILSHEFGASVLVRSTGTQVMGTRLYDLYNTGLYPAVAAMALIMTVVTAALIFAVVAFAGSAVLEGESA